MISNRTTSRRKSLGQGMTEYIIIVALIAVAAIGVYSMFGKTVRNQTAAMAQELGGNSGKESNTKATRAAEAGAKDAAGNKNLRDFSGGNDLKGN